MKTDKITQAEAMRYAKIQRLTNLLCQQDQTILDDLAENSFDKPIKVGKRITIDNPNIIIKNKTYNPYELQKVTINTEGSMAIYDRCGRKLCGWLDLNLSVKNIELFCLWVRKYRVPAGIVSGKRERIFQFSILAMAILTLVLVEFLR